MSRHPASRRRLASVATLAVAAAGAASLVPAATGVAGAATFSAPALVSSGPALQVDGATAPAVSADGRYVAFQGSYAGLAGVYRKDLATGDLELVAGGDASAPSISADGRYVSFSSTQQLTTDATSGSCSSVYVRDMAIPFGTAGAQTLASAIDGSATGIAYADSATAGCPTGGSSAAAHGALSADGRTVVFTVIGASDLMTGVGGATTTPGDQVVTRNLDTQRTTLVSQTQGSLGAAPLPVPGGAALATPDGAGSSTATISADGTTVAWMGIGIPQQAPVAPGSVETTTPAPVQYDEPLWRRLADGPSAPTRRVTGGDDPLACAGCAGPFATDFNPQTTSDGDDFPHAGSFVLGARSTDLTALTPQLSADGATVAFLSTQPSPAVATQLALSGDTVIPTANAYVAHMTPGLTRTQALTPLTSWAGFDFANTASTGQVRSIAISPDGTQVAYTTDRILFPLPQPTPVSQPLNQSAAVQLYDVDLASDTFARVSDGFDQQPADGDVVTPDFSGDGRTLVFASAAANLVYGIGAQSTSVFAITDVTTPEVVGHQTVSPQPKAVAPKVDRVLSVSAKRGAHGTMVLYASVPGAGTARAVARGSVPVTKSVKLRVRGRAVVRRRTVLSTRVVASASAKAKKAGVLRIVLTADRKWDSLVASRSGLVATVTVGFVSKGHKRLAKQLQVSFHGRPAKPKAKVKAKTKIKAKAKTTTKATATNGARTR